jgi:hypothetical protein
MLWCILINTTPKYMPLVEVQITSIRRYAPELTYIPVFLATEMTPASPVVDRILNLPNVHYIKLEESESGFIESRIAAVNYIPNEYEIVLPLQDDFWLDRAPNYNKLREAIEIFIRDIRVKSIRLMPSPGPVDTDPVYSEGWRILTPDDPYKFTFQATMWRRTPYVQFLAAVLSYARKDFQLNESEWSKYCVRVNVAENRKGQEVFMNTSMAGDARHLSVERQHDSPNAVFLAPWPYRPTAVVQGKLEAWALEYLEREGFSIEF